jgi:hypothetical protein
MSKESERATRAETLRGQLELLAKFRARMGKLAPIAGSEGVIWVDMLRHYMYAELATLEVPPDKTHANHVAWAVLYAMYEHSNPTSARPSVFAKAAGLSVKTLKRCRDAGPPIIKKVYAMSRDELRIHWELFARHLQLKPLVRNGVERLIFPPKTRPPRKLP